MKVQPPIPVSTNEEGTASLVELVEQLQLIDLDDPNAEINAISIDDNNGGRIDL